MAVPVAYNDGTSRLDLKQSESPLANLVRRTSSRRRKGREQPQPTAESPEQYAYYPSQHAPTNSNDGTQPKLYLDIERIHSTTTTPHSPLLHSHFARDSIATASSYDDNSYLYTNSSGVRSSTISCDNYGDRLRSSPDDRSDYDYRYFEDDTDDKNMYLGARSGGPPLRDSWRSTDTDATFRKPENFATSGHLSNDLRPPSSQHPQQVEGPLPPVSLPSVLISLHDPQINNTTAVRDGRMPVVKPVINFSRPIHEAGRPEHAGAMGERVTPQLPPDMRDQKLKVLERNARRAMARSSSPSGSMKPRSPPSQTSMYMNGSVSVQDGSNSGTPSFKPIKRLFDFENDRMESEPWQSTTTGGGAATAFIVTFNYEFVPATTSYGFF